jgi:5'-methylthioadenosine phosphorylase
MSVAIIGGTGVYQLGEDGAAELVATPYGDVTAYRLAIDGREVIFLPRHGAGHTVPPHRVNYRANIWALRALGVEEVLSSQSVGSLNLAMAPGNFVALAQFIDWTKGRASTFFDGDDGQVVHVDMTQPYCASVTDRLLQAGAFLGEKLHGGGVYACTEGPRFETAAEIRALRQLGADLVGMTNVPEVVLAREAGLCYAAVGVVCNWGAGMTEFPLTHDEVLGIMAAQSENLQRLFRNFVSLQNKSFCQCGELGFARLLPGLY